MENLSKILADASYMMVRAETPSSAVRDALSIAVAAPLKALAVYTLAYGTSSYELWHARSVSATEPLPTSISLDTHTSDTPFTTILRLLEDDQPMTLLAATYDPSLGAGVNEYLRCLGAMFDSYARQEALHKTLAALRPVNPYRPYHQVLPELTEMARQASKMFCVVFRRIQPGSGALHCEAESGLKLKPSDHAYLDLLQPDPKLMEDMRANRPHPRSDAMNLPAYSNYAGLRDVQSFIVFPIHNRDKLYGTLHFCSLTPHSFPIIEIDLLKRIAEHFAQALRTNILLGRLRDEAQLELETHVAVNMVELSRLARHQVLDEISPIQESLDHIIRQIEKDVYKNTSGARILEPYLPSLQQLLDHSERAMQGLDKMKVFTEWPGRVRKPISLKELIHSAKNMVDSRLRLADIRVDIEGPESLKLPLAPDLVRYAFVALIINSIEAFDTLKDKRARTIRIRVNESRERERFAEVDYFDNAGGINLYSLRGTESSVQITSEDIFKQGVSSKKRSSGHGLYIVRRIISDQDGSIDLVPVKSNGIGFKIKFRKSD